MALPRNPSGCDSADADVKAQLEKSADAPNLTVNSESSENPGTKLETKFEEKSASVNSGAAGKQKKDQVQITEIESHLKVKSEYILDKPHSILSPVQRTPIQPETDLSLLNNPQKANRHKKNVKAMHKRTRDEQGFDVGKACRAIILGKECPYGEKCRYNHDMKEILANREDDITELKDVGCPVFNLKG